MDKRKSGLFRGYVVMLGCAAVNFLLSNMGMQATQFANGLMAQDPSVTLTGTALGLGYTAFALMQGLPGLVIGPYMAQQGPKRVLLFGSVVAIALGVLAAKFIALGTVPYVLFYGLGYGFVGFCTSQLARQTLVNNWFLRKRGLGSAIVSVASALLGLVSPYLLASVTSGGNWRFGWYAIAVAGVVAVVVTLLTITDSPDQVGEVPDGEVVANEPDDEGKASGYVSTVYKRAAGDYVPYPTAIRSFSFWAFAIMAMGGFCVSNLLYSPGSIYFLGEAGMGPEHLANAQVVQTIATLLGAMLINWLSDRIEPMRLVALCVAVMSCGAFLATKAGPDNSFAMYFFYAAAAIGMVGTMQVFAVGLGNFFGIEEFPRLQGLALCIGAVVSSQVSTVAGVVFDAIGSYVPAFVGFAVFGLVCIVPSLFVRIPRQG